ncbi:Tctex 1 [Echinococcus multilocularis]|uniref:Tctex 1 n=1 Tax=Echinococcus multilocularis TaxID=6211 RepID=A0A068Y1W6_ECHMU|nr:Tctex 1 [Echinococcus multilocularis]
MASETALVRGKINAQPETFTKSKAETGHSSLFTITHCDVPNHMTTLRSTYSTYQLEPDVKFPKAIVANIVKEVVDGLLHGREYEPEFCRQASRRMTDVLKARVKSLQLKRYKIITQATLSSVSDPNFYSSSRCLWEPALDTCVSYDFCNGSIVATANVFGIYQS